ncbi:MAG: type IV secretion system protein [Hyphomicrobiaceae bacterium]
MENIVSDIVGAIDAGVKTAGKSMFENTASSIGDFVYICLSILIVLVGINMAVNVYALRMRDSMQIIWRILLVMLFGLTWSNFSIVYDAATEFTGNLALSLFEVAGKSDLGSDPEAAMGIFAKGSQEVTDEILQSQGSIARGILGAFAYAVLVILMGAYVLIVALAKIMTAVLLGLAPFAVLTTIFEKTKSLFEAWLTALIGYLMYPIAAAGVVGSVVLVAKNTDTGAAGGTLIAMTSYVVVMVVGIVALRMIPTVASNITGHMHLGNIAPEALRAVSTPARSAAGAVGGGIADRVRQTVSGFRNDGQTTDQAHMASLRGTGTQKFYAEKGRQLRQRFDTMRKLRGRD